MNQRQRGRPKGSVGKAAILGPADLTKILRTVRTPKKYAGRAEVAFLLSVELGLLAGELSSLRVSDLFEPRGSVRTYSVIGFANMSSASSNLRAALSAYWERNLAGSHQSSPLFRSQRGNGLSRGSLARVLTVLYREAGISTASSRSGRRTANWYAMAARPVATEGLRSSKIESMSSSNGC